MRVAEEIKLLRDAIEEIEGKYCSECQEHDCDFCCIELRKGEERKTGKWVTHEYEINGVKHAYCECTACGGGRPITLFPMNYCPNCGADMRGTNE